MKKINILDIFICLILIGLLIIGSLKIISLLSEKKESITLTFTVTENYSAIPKHIQHGEDFYLNGKLLGRVSAIKSAESGIKIEVIIEASISSKGVEWGENGIKVGKIFDYNSNKVKGVTQCTGISVKGVEKDEN